MDQWDRELAKAGIQMAGAAAKGMGNVMAAVMDGLIEKGVFSIEEVRDMLDRLEVAVTRVEGEIEGDLEQEAEVAATMAIVDHLRDILISTEHPTGGPHDGGGTDGSPRTAPAAGSGGTPVSRSKGTREGDSAWPKRRSKSA